jgi:thiol-disulfide isomerase/thioredoxin
MLKNALRGLFVINLIFVFALLTAANDGHEYAPIQEKTINYKDWTLRSLTDGKPVNLRELARDKKLLLVVYFAQWCPNWRNEAPVISKLYDKYKARGFEIVAVSEYASTDDARKYFGKGGAPYTVVVESEKLEDRDKTAHFTYRQAAGDTRKWGSPFNVFLDPSKFSATSDNLTEKAFVANGELIEDEADKFIAMHLNPPSITNEKSSASSSIKIN